MLMKDRLDDLKSEDTFIAFHPNLLVKSMKSSLDDLAIFGKSPAFKDPLAVGCPNIGDRQKLLARINDALERRLLTNNGPYVQEFERHVADLTGVEHCIAVSNATLGLQLCARALGLTGEVICPSMTFIATAHALEWEGLQPVFADICPKTHNIDPTKIEALINEKTSAILAVHLWGRAAPVEALTEIAKRYNLSLFFDAAHAIGCTHRGRPIGSFGQAEVFSFHATKVVSSFEGGAICTNDSEIAEKLRLLRNFGFAGVDRVVSIGTNAKMNEICAAMGLTSLEALPEVIEHNSRITKRICGTWRVVRH